MQAAADCGHEDAGELVGGGGEGEQPRRAREEALEALEGAEGLLDLKTEEPLFPKY